MTYNNIMKVFIRMILFGCVGVSMFKPDLITDETISTIICFVSLFLNYIILSIIEEIIRCYERKQEE